MGAGLADMAVGLAEVVVHPVQTAQGLTHAALHPVQTGSAVWTALRSSARSIASGNPHAIGRAALEVGTLVLGAGITKLGKLDTLADAALAADIATDAGRIAARSGPALARALGAAGESAANIVKNTIRIDSLTGTARYRIPDVLDPRTGLIGEVKNIVILSYTNQLRDIVMYTKQHGLRFEPRYGRAHGSPDRCSRLSTPATSSSRGDCREPRGRQGT